MTASESEAAPRRGGRAASVPSEPRAPLLLAGHRVAPGTSLRIEIPLARLATQSVMGMEVLALHGAKPGPAVWLSAALHGDELNGIEIIRRVVQAIDVRRLRGTLLCVPIVNVFGFIHRSRYLPDGRDLNRSFPGSPRGSLAARVAHVFMEEIVQLCSHGIDLHTGAAHRTNLPHIRADLTDPSTAAFARAFGSSVIISARTRDGSLRDAGARGGRKVLLFEGGAANRFNEPVIRSGRNGVLRALTFLGMISGRGKAPAAPPLELYTTTWIRARRSGLVRLNVDLGATVEARQSLGVIGDVFGGRGVAIAARGAGIVIGKSLLPLANQGDALVHVAELESGGGAQ